MAKHFPIPLLVLALAAAAPPAGASVVTLEVPAAWSTTAGLGFTITAVALAEGDTLDVALSGAPEGLSFRSVRLGPGETVATLSGVAPATKKTRRVTLTWTVPGRAQATTALEIVPPVNARGDLAAKTRALVCRRYQFGIDAQEVRNLGPGALPHVFAILRDSTCEDYWPAAVAAAGALGLPSVYDSLNVFLRSRFTGDVSTRYHSVFDALFFTPVAQGMAASGRQDVVDSLIAAANPEYWLNLPWRYGPAVGRDLGILMSGRAILGLSVVGDGRAVAALRGLAAAPFDRTQLSYLRDAIERQRKVLSRGWMAVREEERLEQQ